jgi:GT2 family glycosyltransferase
VIDDDIIVLLNNDIRLAKDFFDPIIDNFKHSNRILFVAARGYSVNGEVYEGDHSIPKLRWGIIESSIDFSDQEALINKRGYSFSAGVAAFDRHKFLALGGYDELYLPGRYEDVDLCYRGWKKGYIGLYEPRSVQYHQGGSSFKRNYTQKETAALVFRNSILFTLKNITDIALLFRFFMFTLLRLFYYLSAGKWFFIRAFFEALKRLPLALKRRKHAKKEFLLSDKEVRLKIKDNFVLNTEVRF